MQDYRYQALDTRGQRRRGIIQADSERAARSRLRALGLVPLHLQAAAGSKQPGSWRRRVFSATRRAIWTRQLAALLGSGLPLERSLASLGDEAETAAEQHLLAQLRHDVNGGTPLATALAAFPREFDDAYRAVVAAGEATGRLAEVLHSLADELESADALRQRVLSAMIYPAIISGFALVIVILLMTYVVPQVAQAFAGSRRALPTLTVVMLALSQGLRQWGGLALLLVVTAALALHALLRQPAARLRWDRWRLRWPLLGRLTLQLDMARYAATLALLTGAGVPLLRALQTAAQTLRNHALRADAEAVVGLVREGAPLAAALATQKRLRGLLVTFARLGEQTGQLSPLLQRAAQQLAGDVQRRALRLATLLEPALIIAMGVIVLLIVLAVMLPIIQLNQLVR
jgi:general secretion pathway protein F